MLHFFSSPAFVFYEKCSICITKKLMTRNVALHFAHTPTEQLRKTNAKQNDNNYLTPLIEQK